MAGYHIIIDSAISLVTVQLIKNLVFLSLTELALTIYHITGIIHDVLDLRVGIWIIYMFPKWDEDMLRLAALFTAN